MFLIFRVLRTLLSIYSWIMLIYCVLSFVPNINNRFTQIIREICEPVLFRVRSLISRWTKGSGYYGLDFSPLVVFIAIQILQTVLGLFC